jgi:hypothetical protein
MLVIFISHVHTDINMVSCVDEKRIFYEDKLLWLMEINLFNNCDVEGEFWKFLFSPAFY